MRPERATTISTIALVLIWDKYLRNGYIFFLIIARKGGITIDEKETKARNFSLRDKDGNEIGVFSGKSPRQAALKAANRGHTDIRLRERGTKKVHLFEGQRIEVDKPANAPAWMKDRIWKPQVKKVGIEKIEEI